MLYLLLHWVFTALILLFISHVLAGFHISGFAPALVAVLVLGIVNTLVRPIILLLTLPINILTLGLFSLVINALMLLLTSAIVPGFEISNFWNAFIGAILLMLMNSLLGMLEFRSKGRIV